MSRVLKVTDYGDVHTRKKFEVDRCRTFAMIKPDGYQHMGKIFDCIAQAGFQINNAKMTRFNKTSSSQFYKEHEGKAFFPNLQAHMCSDVCVGIELVAPDAINLWRSVIGPTNT